MKSLILSSSISLAIFSKKFEDFQIKLILGRNDDSTNRLIQSFNQLLVEVGEKPIAN